jgi:hypothetical protein
VESVKDSGLSEINPKGVSMSSRYEPCDACGNDTEAYWQLADRHYCRDCVLKSGGGSSGRLTHQLIEEFQFGCLGSTLLSLWSGLVATAMLTALIVTMFCVINVLTLLAVNPQLGKGLAGFALAIPVFAAFTFAFVSIIGFPLSLILGWTKRPRRLSVEDNVFVAQTSFSTMRLPFKDAVWAIRKLAFDSAGCYFPTQKHIVISSVDPENKASVVCGFTDESFEVWQTFLSLKGIPCAVRTPLISWVKWLGCGAVVGSAFGLLVGAIINPFVGKPIWMVNLGLVGFIDGCFWGFNRANIENKPLEQLGREMAERGTTWWAYYLIVFPITGFLLGMKVVGRGDFSAGLALGTANAIVTTLLGWDCSVARRKRLAAKAYDTVISEPVTDDRR